MKNLMLASILLTVSAYANAEVRPQLPGGGEIRSEQCGTNSRELNVCVAKASRSNGYYIVINKFPGQISYIPVERKVLNAGIAGSSRILFTGRAAVKDMDKKLSENNYELLVSTIIVPNSPTTATLKVNGIPVGQVGFKMEDLYYTQGL